jgi:microcystin-dependent protein
MAQPYIGEIRMFAGNFAPAGWMFCEGQLLSISENDTLFQLIGTTYGGDGQTNFALPDLRGRLPLHQGNGFAPAQTGGAEQVTLSQAQLPSHTHPLQAVNARGNQTSPGGNLPAQSFNVVPYINDAPTGDFNLGAVLVAGGNQPHNNFQPYLCVNFIISLFGIFPTQT